VEVVQEKPTDQNSRVESLLLFNSHSSSELRYPVKLS